MWLRVTGKPPRLSPAGASVTSVKPVLLCTPTCCACVYHVRHVMSAESVKSALLRQIRSRDCRTTTPHPSVRWRSIMGVHRSCHLGSLCRSERICRGRII